MARKGTNYGPVKEKDVWAKFKRAWPRHAERQEPGAGFDAGRPDVLVLGKCGMPGFVELKAPARFRLRPSQWIWAERWLRNAGRLVVLSYSDKGYWMLVDVTYEMAKVQKLGKPELCEDTKLAMELVTYALNLELDT